MPSINFNLNDVKPLAAALGLGQAPSMAAPPVNQLPTPAMPAQPLPVPAQAGFGPWVSDPATQKKISDGITPPGQSLLPPQPGAYQVPPVAASSQIPPAMAGGTTAPNPAAVGQDQPAALYSQQAPPTMDADMAAHPDQYRKPGLVGQGWKGFLRYGIPAALVSAGSGLSNMGRGNPTAGMEMIANQVAQDRGLPAANAATYDLRNIKPLKDAAALADTQSQTAQRNAMANKANTQADAVGDPAQRRAKDIAAAAKLGSVPVYDEKGNLTGYAPDEKSTVYQKNQALAQLEQARSEYSSAQADLDKSKNNPKSPLFQQAQSRIRTAQQNAQTAAGRLGLSGQEFVFNQDKFYNPQPTAAERGKGDLAQSAVERVAEMKAIVAKHPEYFGPGAGRAQNAQAWIGSSDPDAVTYNTAAQYLADHSAGVFGGRGQYITQALHDITSPRYTPEGLNAALDEADRAAQGFVKAGAVHGKGGGAPAPPTGGGSAQSIPAAAAAQLKEGQMHTFGNGQTWTLQGGKPVRIK